MQLEHEKGLLLVDKTLHVLFLVVLVQTNIHSLCKAGIRPGTVLRALGHTEDKWSFGFTILPFQCFTDVIFEQYFFFLIPYRLFKKDYNFVGWSRMIGKSSVSCPILISLLRSWVIEPLISLPKFGIETSNREIIWHFLHMLGKFFFWHVPICISVFSIFFGEKQNSYRFFSR